MKKRMHMARRRMNHVVSELNHAMLLAGCRELNLRLVREEEGLRLHIQGGFAPENRTMVERMAALLQPAVRDPALVETYWAPSSIWPTSDISLSLVYWSSPASSQ